jgi:hypothetical protein
MHSVLQAWVFTLPFRMQSVLMAALRGCDTARKDDPSKTATRGIRACLCNNADPSNTFIGDPIPKDEVIKQFLWDLDSYPMHFVAHTMHAAEIIGYKHPDRLVSAWWCSFYKDLVKALHLNPESEDQLDVRLGFTEVDEKVLKESPKEPKVKTKKSDKWDAGTGTSHGGRDREWSGGS